MIIYYVSPLWNISHMVSFYSCSYPSVSASLKILYEGVHFFIRGGRPQMGSLLYIILICPCLLSFKLFLNTSYWDKDLIIT